MSLYQHELTNTWSNIPRKPFPIHSLVPRSTDKENSCFADPHHRSEVFAHKYKTELCKNWEERGYCTYGPKCRFAHGIHELNCKERLNGKYKSRPCQAFFATMFCPYGNRCLFKHDERKVGDISKLYYTLLNTCPEIWQRMPKRRLATFVQLMNKDDIYEVQGKTVERMILEDDKKIMNGVF